MSKIISAASLASVFFVLGCSPNEPDVALTGEPSPYLLTFVGDDDEQEADFLLTIDIDPQSDARGEPIATELVGCRGSMPHHMEYERPPNGEPIFMNAHHHELTMIVDVSQSTQIDLEASFAPPPPFRFPHDYTRTPHGTRLVGFLRSEGPSPDPEENILPGNHGGIAEYTADGELIRSVSAAVPGLQKAVRPYAFALLPEQDRFVVTSAPMLERSWADVVQVYRYSDFELLNTIGLPVGVDRDGVPVEGSEAAGFGPRVLDDGTVFFNTYGCGFYHLSDIATDNPTLETVYTIDTPPAPEGAPFRGACGIPVRIGDFWVQPVGRLHQVVVLDISDPSAPVEVSRLETPDWFKPHWLSKDPTSNRLVLGAELGGEHGFFILRIDEASGAVAFDDDFRGRNGRGMFARAVDGYVSLQHRNWPHGRSDAAWGHAALFWGGEER